MKLLFYFTFTFVCLNACQQKGPEENLADNPNNTNPITNPPPQVVELSNLHKKATKLSAKDLNAYLTQEKVSAGAIPINMNRPDANGKTAFFLAAERGDIEKMKVLVKHGADPSFARIDPTGKNPYTALYETIAVVKTPELVKALLDMGADINKGTVGSAPIHAATSVAHTHNDYSFLDELIKHVPKKLLINRDNAEGKTALGMAVEFNDKKLIEYLLNANANINAGKKPPLAIAIETKNEELIKYLLDEGANVKKLNGPVMAEFNVSLDHFISTNNIPIVQLLLGEGLEVPSEALKSALELDSDEKSLAMLKLLTPNLINHLPATYGWSDLRKLANDKGYSNSFNFLGAF